MTEPKPPSPRTIALANRILDHVVDQKLSKGAPLREVSLANILNVSRTPVRSALRLLEEQRHVEAVPNRGFFLATDGESLRKARLDMPPSTTSILFSAIIRAYIAGTIPASFSQNDLTRTFKVPRAPLVQVLSQMESEGIIIRAGQSYTFQPILENHTALRNSYQLREALEPAALRLPQFHADPVELAEFRQRHEQMIRREKVHPEIGDEVFVLDAEFHEFLARSAGNLFFLQAIQQQNRLRRVIDIVSYEEALTRERISRWCQEHLNVIEALETGDNQLAADLLAIHLRYATQESDRLAKEYFVSNEGRLQNHYKKN
ncbi:GntR family transcriptional regulator [Pseudochelatococcus sp. B33]